MAAAPERHWRRESRRAWFWGLGVPLATVLASLMLGWFGLLLLLVYPLQVVRLARRGEGSTRQKLAAGFLSRTREISRDVRASQVSFEQIRRRQVRVDRIQVRLR